VTFDTWETGCPILADALANFECETKSMHDGGDHVIFVGQMLALRTGEGRPLLYYRGAYRQIIEAT
jgi:flavin reductase (DIM6/NTAB) family NADH-FMN oxidoreductase RutF